jgi:hypothetical protein
MADENAGVADSQSKTSRNPRGIGEQRAQPVPGDFVPQVALTCACGGRVDDSQQTGQLQYGAQPGSMVQQMGGERVVEKISRDRRLERGDVDAGREGTVRRGGDGVDGPDQMRDQLEDLRGADRLGSGSHDVQQRRAGGQCVSHRLRHSARRPAKLGQKTLKLFWIRRGVDHRRQRRYELIANAAECIHVPSYGGATKALWTALASSLP